MSSDGKPNIITLGMYMPISFKPPMVVIGVSPKRYSHRLIAETGEFVVNVPTEEIIEETVFCGTHSGRDVDKFGETKLTPVSASRVKPPLIEECVSHLECKVVASHKCGDHTIFVGKVVAVHIDEGVMDETLNILKAQTISHKGPIYFIPKPFYEFKG